jgi:hypothetical protein
MDLNPDEYPPEEAERRAGELARRLLTTPPKPQSEIKGKRKVRRVGAAKNDSEPDRVPGSVEEG